MLEEALKLIQDTAVEASGVEVKAIDFVCSFLNLRPRRSLSRRRPRLMSLCFVVFFTRIW